MTHFRTDYQQYLWAPFTQMGDLSDEEPVVMVSGKGAQVTDSRGRTFIDVHGALWLANAGFGRTEIVEAAYEQMKKLSFFPSFDGMSHQAAVSLARRLVKLTESLGMGRIFFSCGGSEAVETALKMAWQYWNLKGKPRKHKIIARRRAYHGVTMGALAANGLTSNRQLFEPLVPGFRHIPPPYCYRCPYELSRDSCSLQCARELEKTIEFEDPDTVAAFIGEPVMGAGGVIVPPDGYWQEIQRICREYDILLIADEVITGFGRTGKLFGCQHWGVQPDIMVFAKALTSGYLPLGATAAREELWEVCLGKQGEGREFRHGNTFAGHAAACAAAAANLDIIEREGLVEQAHSKGHYLLERLQELYRMPVVGNVDGLGLLARVELVSDKDTKLPFAPPGHIGRAVHQGLLKRGIILRALGDVLSLSPPLVITQAEIDEVVDNLGEVIQDVNHP